MASRREPADAGRFGPSGCGGRFPDKGTTGTGPEGKPKAVTKARPAAVVRTPPVERREVSMPIARHAPRLASVALFGAPCGAPLPSF